MMDLGPTLNNPYFNQASMFDVFNDPGGNLLGKYVGHYPSHQLWRAQAMAIRSVANNMHKALWQRIQKKCLPPRGFSNMRLHYEDTIPFSVYQAAERESRRQRNSENTKNKSGVKRPASSSNNLNEEPKAKCMHQENSTCSDINQNSSHLLNHLSMPSTSKSKDETNPGGGKLELITLNTGLKFSIDKKGTLGDSSAVVHTLSSDDSDDANDGDTGVISQECMCCDICYYTVRSTKYMAEHLKRANHYSASKVIATVEKDTSLLPQARIEDMAIINTTMSAWDAELVPMCPDPSCKLAFKNIYCCSSHYRLSHDKTSSGVYGLAKIMFQKTIAFSIHAQCVACKNKFATFKKLHIHWTNTPVCNPIPTVVDGLFYVFLCPFCDDTFTSFHATEMHVLDCRARPNMEKRRKKPRQEPIIHPPDTSYMTVICLSKMDKMNLLPIQKRPGEELAKLELARVKQLKKELPKDAKNKESKRIIKAEVASLNSLANLAN